MNSKSNFEYAYSTLIQSYIWISKHPIYESRITYLSMIGLLTYLSFRLEFVEKNWMTTTNELAWKWWYSMLKAHAMLPQCHNREKSGRFSDNPLLHNGIKKSGENKQNNTCILHTIRYKYIYVSMDSVVTKKWLHTSIAGFSRRTFGIKRITMYILKGIEKSMKLTSQYVAIISFQVCNV